MLSSLHSKLLFSTRYAIEGDQSSGFLFRNGGQGQPPGEGTENGSMPLDWALLYMLGAESQQGLGRGVQDL